MTTRRAALYCPTAVPGSNPWAPDGGGGGEGGGGGGGNDAPGGGEPKLSTPEEVQRIAKREADEAARKERQRILEEIGVDDPAKAKELIEAQRAREQAELSEAERARKAAEDAETAAKNREREAIAAQLKAAKLIALTKAGVNADDVDDAEVLLQVADDATDEQITEAVEKLKERRSEMFGKAPTEPRRTPSGGPGGPPPAPRRTPSKQEKRGSAGLAEAARRGFINDKDPANA